MEVPGPLPREEVEQLVRGVVALWRQHRRPVVAVGVRGQIEVPLWRAREQLAAALAQGGIAHASVAMSQDAGPLRLEVIEFAP